MHWWMPIWIVSCANKVFLELNTLSQVGHSNCFGAISITTSISLTYAGLKNVSKSQFATQLFPELSQCIQKSPTLTDGNNLGLFAV